MSSCQNIVLQVIIICGLVNVLLIYVSYRAGRSGRQKAIELERLVRERTLEMRKRVETHQRSEAERAFLLDGISKRINACLATMKGLNGIAATYENMPPDLVKNIDITTDTLADILRQIAKEKRL